MMHLSLNPHFHEISIVSMATLIKILTNEIVHNICK